MEEDVILEKVLYFSRFLVKSQTTFYINIKTSNGLRFELNTTKHTGYPHKFGECAEVKKWNTPMQLARDKCRLQAFHDHKRAERDVQGVMAQEGNPDDMEMLEEVLDFSDLAAAEEEEQEPAPVPG